MLKIEKLSASSITTFSSCEMDFFCQYILKLPQIDRVSTTIGTAVHTFLEVLAKLKLNQQKGLRLGIEHKQLGYIDQTHTDKYIADICYNYYENQYSNLNWDNAAEDKYYGLIETATSSKYSPQNQEIIEPERYFKFPLTEFDWAHYTYLDDDNNVQKDCLVLSGLIDLLYRNEYDEVVFLDYKTGKPEYDWNAGKQYKYKDYHYNIQLCLYYYVVTKLFPKLGNPVVQIWYLQNDKVITLNFGKQEITYIINKIRKTFNTAKSIDSPKKNVTYKCKAFCPWGKQTMTDIKKSELSLVSDGSQHLTSAGEEMMICEVVHKFSKHRSINTIIDNVNKTGDKKENG